MSGAFLAAMRRFTPLTWIAVALGVLVLAGLLYAYATRDGGARADRIGSGDSAAMTAQAAEQRCSASRTYDAIKRELFRRAAQTRGTDRAAFDQVAAYSSLRVEEPLLKDRDEELDTLRCSASVALDLPPGTKVVAGRRTLAAEIEYVIQRATDGSGDVVMVEGAEAITVPLATLARVGGASAGPLVPPPPIGTGAEPETNISPESELPPPPDRPSAATSPPSVAERPPVSPSFDCRNARTRGEVAVCGDPRLAALDRQMAAQYVRAVSAGSLAQRALLSRTRDAFLRHRDSCPNEACIAETYRGRMREIADIMAGRWNPGG